MERKTHLIPTQEDRYGQVYPVETQNSAGYPKKMSLFQKAARAIPSPKAG